MIDPVIVVEVQGVLLLRGLLLRETTEDYMSRRSKKTTRKGVQPRTKVGLIRGMLSNEEPHPQS